MPDASRHFDALPAAPGVGFKAQHFAEITRDAGPVRWLEIHPENYVARGGLFAQNLERAMESWRLVPHGLSLCLGTVTPFDEPYKRQLAGLLDRIVHRL